MAKETTETRITPDPDQRQLTQLQAKRLAGLTGLDSRALAGKTIGSIVESLRWRIEPPRLFFRRVCGQVVRKDPVSGAEYPVPFATVHVEDTDCHLLGYFPAGWKWGWFFPLHCHREEIATVKTDECGRFCAWIPWFDIDWILHWRRVRICFPDIFIRPNIRDLIPIEPVPPLPGPGPGPGPDPFLRLAELPATAISRLSTGATRHLAERLSALQVTRAFGGPEAAPLEEERAFVEELPPPLPSELREAEYEPGRKGGADAVRKTLAAQLGVEVGLLQRFDPQRFIGPFLRCFDVLLPQWYHVLDVPDITFRVTQDVNGDGTEETVYSEGFFDVRWNAGPLPNVKLYAGPAALVSHVGCETPEVPCGNQPALLFAGLMPLTSPGGAVDPYHDVAIGYARRPNRPHPSGNFLELLPKPLASTPYCRTLQLYGCVEIPGAQFYRVLYSVDDGATFTPFVGLSWPLNRAIGGPPWQIWATADANGWYPVIPAAQGWYPPNLVLEWTTGGTAKYVLRLQVGNGAKNPIATAPDVAFRIDNTGPAVVFDQLAWKFAGEPDSAFNLPGRSLLGACPTIHRGAVPHPVQVLMRVSVAALHFRNGWIDAVGCGGGAPTLAADPANHVAHWHTSAFDNAEQFYARYDLGAGLLEGAYHFRCWAYSRAFNPAGHDGGHVHDWNYDPIEIWVNPQIAVALVNSS